MPPERARRAVCRPISANLKAPPCALQDRGSLNHRAHGFSLLRDYTARRQTGGSYMLKIALVSALATATFSMGAHAAPVCGKRDDVVGQLSEKYKEESVGIGLASNGASSNYWP